MDFERVLRKAGSWVRGSSMLSDAEKRDLREMARSAAAREEFRAAKAASAIPPGADVDVDAFVAFLTAMHRTLPLVPRDFVRHERVLL